MNENTIKETFFSKILTMYIESKEAASERYKMPIATFYIFILIITYWEPISIYIFSNKTIEYKAEYINFLYKNEAWYIHYYILLKSLILGFALSVIFPLLTFYINKLTKKAKIADIIEKENNKERLRIDEEKQAIHEYKRSNIKSGQLEKEEYNRSVDNLKQSYEDRIKSLNENHYTEIENLKDSNKSQKVIIDKLEKAIIENKISNDQYFPQKRKSNAFDANYHLANIINRFNTETIALFTTNSSETSFRFNDEENYDKNLEILVNYFINNNLARPIEISKNFTIQIDFNLNGKEVINQLKETLPLL